MTTAPLPEDLSLPPSSSRRNGLRQPLVVSLVTLGVLLLLILFYRFSIDILLFAGILIMVILAYWNGANDVSKAIATLVGSGVSHYRTAMIYGSICTVAGASLSAVLAAGLVSTFTRGLIANPVHLTEQFALAAVLGALAWVYLATRLALPVSTTHAITGSVVATGVIAFGFQNVLWGNLGSKIVLPLLLSPVVAFAAGVLLFWILRLLVPERIPLHVLHWISSGFASFTRGLNDTPKIVALGVVFFLTQGKGHVAPLWLFFLVALAMGVGSLIGGLKVTRTLAEKVTKMDHREGFAANLATAVLVGLASPLSLPVSTTHVSSCAIIGIGVRKGIKQVRWRTVGDMALAWVITLPVAGLLGALVYGLLLLSFH